MKQFMRLIALCALPLLLLTQQARAGVIELSLLVDASNSISNTQWNLQMNAYSSIFSSGSFYDDYVTGGDDLWVNMIIFARGSAESIGWTLINDNASATTFGTAVSGVSRVGLPNGNTWHDDAMQTAVASILNNDITSDRAVIDMSTDGAPYPSNRGPGAITAAGDAYTNHGIVTNAIGIGSGISNTFLTNLTNAGNGFFVTASDFQTFQSVLERKLYTEINDTPVPEPASIALLGLGLAGLGLSRRKRA